MVIRTAASCRATAPAFGAALDLQARVEIDLDDAAHVGQQVYPQALGHAGADLGRVAVDRLLAGEDQVHGLLLADLADRRGQRVARGQRVGAGERAVGDQHRVGAKVSALRRLSSAEGGPMVEW
jgi:hypothetical protein